MPFAFGLMRCIYMQVFVETHYYDGGLKTCLVPGSRRPDFVPSADLIGLRSTEAELAEGDYALELTQIHSRSHHIIWLGCYTKGMDFKHGDRSTYCGVGVWLVDAVLIHSLHLVAFLRDAAAKVALGPTTLPETLGKLRVFADEFAELGWCAPRNQARSPRQATNALYGSGDDTSYLLLPDNRRESFDLAGIDLVGQCRISSSSKPYSRRVYFLAPRSRVFARQTEQLAYKSALTYAEHLIHTMDMAASSENMTRRAAVA
jgi:hypothetical protein